MCVDRQDLILDERVFVSMLPSVSMLPDRRYDYNLQVESVLTWPVER